MPDLAVILISWNVRALILDALRTLTADLATSGLDAEVWVVDNASSDGSPDAIRAEFPQVHLIAGDKNLGFGAGNNVALRALGFRDEPTPVPDGPRAVFLLNSDTRILPGAVRALYDTLTTQSNAGIVGARLEYDDGSFQDGAFAVPGLAQLVIDLFPLGWLPHRVFNRLYSSRLNGRYPRVWYDGGRAFPVGHTLGATMLLRREVIEQTGLFDEQFFMYCEEIDWSLRIREAGWQIYCQPNARVVHLGGQSTSQIRTESLTNLWRSRLLLYAKHYPPLKRWLARRLVWLSATLRLWAARNVPEVRRAEYVRVYQAIRALLLEKKPHRTD
ncbi:MAG: glycosyltransferase family 2 protein [Aggregatilineales bacterium]